MGTLGRAAVSEVMVCRIWAQCPTGFEYCKMFSDFFPCTQCSQTPYPETPDHRTRSVASTASWPVPRPLENSVGQLRPARQPLFFVRALTAHAVAWRRDPADLRVFFQGSNCVEDLAPFRMPTSAQNMVEGKPTERSKYAADHVSLFGGRRRNN